MADATYFYFKQWIYAARVNVGACCLILKGEMQIADCGACGLDSKASPVQLI